MSDKKEQKFQPVPSRAGFVDKENHWLNYWDDKGIVEKYLHKNDTAEKRFSFFDGPITANNPMGVHHAWGRTMKDLIQRYKNMRGYKQRFQNGFDCQGLWVEVEVEKEKGFKSKKDIEDYGIAQFVKDCKARVEKYSAIQTKQSQRLGYFMDWDNSYYTMSEENNYMIWHFLKQCWQDGLIYQGRDAVPWCPRCGTAISQHEIDTEGYQQITHQAVYMRFPVVKDGQEQEDEFLLVWTTTPWTIPADTLVAVHPEIDYAQVKYEGKKYWLAESLAEKVLGGGEVLKTVTGQELIEQEGIDHYRAAFDNLPIIQEVAGNEHFHQVVLAENLVNEAEGTGLVHIVPGAGTEDHQLVKKELGWDEVIFPVVDESGTYIDGYGNLSGQNAKDHPELVVAALEEIEGGRYLFKTAPYTHAYPTCWRCKTELIWRLVDEWYIAMDKGRPSDGKTLRERMISVAKQINWLPEFGLARELDWLENMHDWLISKKRYWGLALPIWHCPDCDHFEIIGGKDELQEKAVSGWKEFSGHTPHRPWIDRVKIACPDCGEPMERIKDVGNPWLDAGIIPFSTLVDPETDQVSYVADKKYWQNWFPADFITECFPGQFRNWFYALIAMATELEDTAPFETILGHGLVKDENNEEMHKSKGNAIWFDDAAEKMGVDVMRWLYLKSPPEQNVNFGYNKADEVRRQFHLLLWNIYRFFVTYANLAQGVTVKPTADSKHVLDRWILSRLHGLISQVNRNLDEYQPHRAANAIEDFVQNLSLWHIRRSRNRMKPENPNQDDLANCLQTLHYVLVCLVKILAPFNPFLAEEIYQNLAGGKDSVHLEDWPKLKEDLIDPDLEKNMQLIRDIASQAHNQRKKAQIKLRQPLGKLTVSNLGCPWNEEFAQLLKEELNVKEVDCQEGKGDITVQLDTQITESLKKEGQARDIIRQIQRARKKAQLDPQDKIVIQLPDWPKEFEEEIKKQTSVTAIKSGDKLAIIDEAE